MQHISVLEQMAQATPLYAQKRWFLSWIYQSLECISLIKEVTCGRIANVSLLQKMIQLTLKNEF